MTRTKRRECPPVVKRRFLISWFVSAARRPFFKVMHHRLPFGDPDGPHAENDQQRSSNFSSRPYRCTRDRILMNSLPETSSCFCYRNKTNVRVPRTTYSTRSSHKKNANNHSEYYPFLSLGWFDQSRAAVIRREIVSRDLISAEGGFPIHAVLRGRIDVLGAW